MVMKFDTSDNILDWSPTLVQTKPYSMMFCYIKFKKSKRMSFIESEIDAIERINLLREMNESNGVHKPESYYHYAKIAIMEMNDMGFARTEEHFFRDTNGDNIAINYN